MMIIKYLNIWKEISIVKIRITEDSNDYEFEVFFSRLDTEKNQGMDVTINWKNLNIQNNGTFFTDSNAYKIVKRDINAPKPYN